MLSWSAKFGLSLPDRAVLGRHVSAYSEAGAVYSRDLAVGAVTKLQELLHQVAIGSFLPDAARSGYRPIHVVGDQVEPPIVEAVVKVEDESEQEPQQSAAEELGNEVDAGSFSASSDGSESLEHSDAEDEAGPPAPKCYRHFAKGPLEGKFVVHKTSRKVHYTQTQACWMGKDPG